MKILITIVLLSTLIGTSIRPVNAEAPQRSISEYSVSELITHYTTLYGSSEREIRLVGVCESGLRQVTNPNDGGSPSIGMFQYKVGTWARYSKLLGEELDINSPHDQIKLTSFIFAEHPKEKRAWTCSKITGII